MLSSIRFTGITRPTGWRAARLLYLIPMTKRKPFKSYKKLKECFVCGSNLGLEVDHWDNDNSNDRPSNAKTLCRICNTDKALFYKQNRDPRNLNYLNIVEDLKCHLGEEGFRRRQEERHRESEEKAVERRYVRDLTRQITAEENAVAKAASEAGGGAWYNWLHYGIPPTTLN